MILAAMSMIKTGKSCIGEDGYLNKQLFLYFFFNRWKRGGTRREEVSGEGGGSGGR